MNRGTNGYVGILLAGSAMLLATSTGCVGLIANLLYATTGNKVPARYEGLEERRVAVVCIDSQSGFGPSPISSELASRISRHIKANVKKVSVLDSQVVEDWIDRNEWDYLDFYAVGKGVNAESIVAIDIDTFSMHEGSTMFKGKANVHVAVYDILENGKEVYRVTPRQIEYPVNAGYHTTEMTERDFRQLFLDTLSQQIARHFYAYDAIEDYARDVTLVGNR